MTANAAARTVTINLVAPDAEFKYRLAVPARGDRAGGRAEQGLGHQADSRHRAVHVQVVQPQQAAVLERNPHFKEWSAAAQPAGYPDKITYRSG